MTDSCFQRMEASHGCGVHRKVYSEEEREKKRQKILTLLGRLVDAIDGLKKSLEEAGCKFGSGSVKRERNTE